MYCIYISIFELFHLCDYFVIIIIDVDDDVILNRRDISGELLVKMYFRISFQRKLNTIHQRVEIFHWKVKKKGNCFFQTINLTQLFLPF